MIAVSQRVASLRPQRFQTLFGKKTMLLSPTWPQSLSPSPSLLNLILSLTLALPNSPTAQAVEKTAPNARPITGLEPLSSSSISALTKKPIPSPPSAANLTRADVPQAKCSTASCRIPSKTQDTGTRRKPHAAPCPSPTVEPSTNLISGNLQEQSELELLVCAISAALALAILRGPRATELTSVRPSTCIDANPETDMTDCASTYLTCRGRQRPSYKQNA
mmetsp:Transcript_46473/g.61573  ORF Transcript_46473/g.61573 Transcript_46473/m.61573 type:complete len:220 (+) Transcript_46473:475-1134(+)